MQEDKLKQIINDQFEIFNTKKHKLIDRDINLEKYINTKQIIIISGIRRCGKSSLLYLIKKKLSLKKEDYIYFNFDDERITNNKEIFNQIYQIHLELYDKEPIFFLDEIQNIKGWEKFANRMYEKGLKLFITGSNANLLSSEISTSLTGRNLVLNLFPFSFKEFLKSKNIKFNKEITTKLNANIKREFNKFLKYGGFPLVTQEENLELINSYFNDIIYRDIIARFNITQIEEIKQLAVYLASNIGKLFSLSMLQKFTDIKSVSTIKNYTDYFKQSFLFDYLKKYDYSIKKQILNPRKAYIIDLALANQIGFQFSENKGRLLENLVFIELKRRNKDLFYHKDTNECDFLIKEKNKIISAIQVTYTLNENNKEREINGLIEALTIHKLEKGLILTSDLDDELNINGKKITMKPIWKWLLDI